MKRKRYEDARPVREKTVQSSTQLGAVKPRDHCAKDTYDGAELRAFTGRPGAMDAFALPSRGSFD